MAEFFKRPGLVLVSRIDLAGWWAENATESVAAGTALGDDCTTNVFTPSAEGRTAQYDRTTGAWGHEREDMRATPFYSAEGFEHWCALPDAERPEWAILEPPPEYDRETQAVRHEGGAWLIYDDHTGRNYWGPDGLMDIVADSRFTLPDGGTWGAPPDARPGHATRLVAGEWVQVEDHDGETIYSHDGVSSDIMQDVGPVPEGWTTVAPPGECHIFESGVWVPDVPTARAYTVASVNRWRTVEESDEAATVPYDGAEWDAGPSARTRIDAVLLTATMPPYWTDANNVDHEGFTLEQLTGVRAAINARGFAIHDRQRTMKKEIDALEDFDAIMGYPVGW